MLSQETQARCSALASRLLVELHGSIAGVNDSRGNPGSAHRRTRGQMEAAVWVEPPPDRCLDHLAPTLVTRHSHRSWRIPREADCVAQVAAASMIFSSPSL